MTAWVSRFDCVVFGAGQGQGSWKLHRGNKTLVVHCRPRFTVNDFDFLVDAALAGLGIAMLPVFRCEAHLRTRRLQRLLPEWCSPNTPIHAVYPSTRHISPKVKAFLDHLGESAFRAV